MGRDRNRVNMIGKTLGHYEVTDQLGKGGMGEVYRARDTKLGREVAIKLLPAAFAQDSERVARLEREARMLAALNHPNIAAIYGLEQSDDTRFLVLELVEGDTLADRLKRGAVAPEESVHLALQIAEALEAAHEKGVIHRDLKPANIKVTPDGKVKVLDFGLAKAFSGEQADVNLSNSPTLSMQATQQGVILGTAGYMSPEQASGGASDKRADIWSFGVVLFETLAGHQVFTGDTISHVLAAVLAKDPQWSTLPPNLHPKLRELLERCLEKDPKNRYHDVADVRLDLQKISADPGGLTFEPAVAPQAAPAFGTKIVALAAAVAVVAGGLGWFLRPAPEPGPGVVTRFDISLPDGQLFSRPELAQLAIAPDGTRLAYVADNQIYVREFGDMAPRAVPGTFVAGSGVATPVFSPDGEWLAYVEVANLIDSRILRVPVSGGTPLEVYEGPLGQVSWPTEDALLFTAEDGINRIPANGGEPELVIPSGEDELLFSPQLIPDGDRVLFTRVSGTAPNAASFDAGQILVQRIGGEERTLVWEGGSDARYLASGHVVYAQGDTLWGLRVDPETFQVLAGPVSVVEGTQRSSAGLSDTAQYGVSDHGALVHLPGTAISVSTTRSLYWVDPDGSSERISAPPSEYRMARISPDGTRVALVDGAQGDGDIWVYDLAAETPRQLTFGDAEETYPVWTPDGERILFHSNDPSQQGVYSVPAIGGEPEFIAPSEDNGGQFPTSITTDGGTVLALTVAGAADVSISVLDLGSSDEFDPLLADDLIMGDPTLAPNGNWMASAEQEGNGTFVNIRPFPDVTRSRVLPDPAEVARHPVFSNDSSTLFYYRIGVGIFGVTVAYEPSISVGTPEALVSGSYWWGVNAAGGGGGRAWDRHPTDGRFLMIGLGTDTGNDLDGPLDGPRINVILNWFEELEERLPAP